MTRLPEVEKAKLLMTEAMVWSVMKWLREKKTVRKTADLADAALDHLDEKTKARWDDALKSAYASLAAGPAASRAPAPPSKPAPTRPPKQAPAEVLALAKKIKHADDEAYRARMDAEKTFDDAEKKLSTALAREGCHKAIHGWDLHEKAIALAESAL